MSEDLLKWCQDHQEIFGDDLGTDHHVVPLDALADHLADAHQAQAIDITPEALSKRVQTWSVEDWKIFYDKVDSIHGEDGGVTGVIYQLFALLGLLFPDHKPKSIGPV